MGCRVTRPGRCFAVRLKHALPAAGGAPSAFFFFVPGTEPVQFRSAYVTAGGLTVYDATIAQNAVAVASVIGHTKASIVISTFVGPTTITLFKNGIATPLSIVIAGGSSGPFSSAVTVTFAPGDLLSWQIAAPPGEPGGLIAGQLSYDFTNKPGGVLVTSEVFLGAAVPLIHFFGVPASRDTVINYPDTTAPITTHYLAPSRMTINSVRLATNLYTFSSGPTTVVLQRNGADTPVMGSIAGVGTVLMPGSQIFDPGDRVNFRVTTPPGVAEATFFRCSYKTQIAAGGVQPLLVNFRGVLGIPDIFVGAGIDRAGISGPAEPAAEWLVPGPMTVPGTSARLNVATNNFTMPVTLTLRKNAADTGLVFVVPAGITGIFLPFNVPVAYAGGDFLSWKMTTVQPVDDGKEARATLYYEFV